MCNAVTNIHICRELIGSACLGPSLDGGQIGPNPATNTSAWLAMTLLCDMERMYDGTSVPEIRWWDGWGVPGLSSAGALTLERRRKSD